MIWLRSSMKSWAATWRPYTPLNARVDILHSRADITKARELLGFEPRVDFAEGLRRTVDWYRHNPSQT